MIDWNQTFAGITYGTTTSPYPDRPRDRVIFITQPVIQVFWKSMDPPLYPAVSNGLVSWWRFDETSGTTASPSIGSHNGTLTSPASFGTGKFGNAVIFTGAENSKANFPAAAGILEKHSVHPCG